MMLRPVEILLVEDNPADVRLMEEALRETRSHNLRVAHDGATALALLCQAEGFAGALRPDLILLDLNLPPKSGLETLAEIKTDPRFRRIPVIVLTNSAAQADVLAAYNLHANAYITKPTDVEQFFAIVQAIEQFYLSTAQLPDD